MGKYDGPHFSAENQVSIWLAHVPFAEIPENYWIPDWEDESDDGAWNDFSADFGFGYYDDDFVESFCDEEGAPLAIYDQLKYLSFSKSFIQSAVSAGRAKGIESTTYVFVIYDFKYDPIITGIDKSKYLTFIGAFDLDKDKDSEYTWQA